MAIMSMILMILQAWSGARWALNVSKSKTELQQVLAGESKVNVEDGKFV
jgi:hypothetical protein